MKTFAAAILVAFVLNPVAWAVENPVAGRTVNIQFKPNPKLTLASDRTKARQLVLAQTMERVNQGDVKLFNGLYRASQAQNPRQASDMFRYETGRPFDGMIDPKSVGPIMKEAYETAGKFGVPFMGPAAGTVDILMKVDEFLSSQTKPIPLADVPLEFRAVMEYSIFNKLKPEIQDQLIQEMTEAEGKPFTDVIRQVRDNRMLNDESGKEAAKVMATPGLNAVKNELSAVRVELEAQARQRASDLDKQTRLENLERETAHMQASVYLTSTILGPVIGPQASRTISVVGNNLIQMNHAIKEFGPGGLHPDKLLMMTNFVSAGMAIGGLLMASQQQDPTQIALQQILQELQAIRKQLERIENKIDELSALVLTGFEKVLNDTAYLKARFDNFERLIVDQIKDETQRRAIQEYLNLRRGTGDFYNVDLKCASPKRLDVSANECSERFLKELATSTQRTLLNQERDADIFLWSNEMLSHRAFADSDDRQIVLEQLSIPIYFADSPTEFRSMIARGLEATVAYASTVLALPHPQTLANPEVLLSRLDALVKSIQLRPEMRSERGLLNESIARINDIQSAMEATVGAPRVMEQLTGQMTNDLRRYEQLVRGVHAELQTSAYSEMRRRLWGKDQTIKPCSGTDMLPIPIPAPEKSGMSIDKYIPQVYWIAQEMGLGRIGLCYSAKLVSAETRSHGVFVYYPVQFEVKAFFNDSFTSEGTPLIESEGQLPEFSQRSKLISARALKSKLHYHSYYGTWGAPYYITTHAWTATAPAPHDIGECHVLFGGKRRMERGIPGYESLPPGACANGQIYSLRDHFLSDSFDVSPAATATQNLTEISQRVNAVVKGVVLSRSEIWDARSLGPAYLPVPENLRHRDVMKKPFLRDALKAYSQKYLLMQNLLLVSLYNENPVSKCMQALWSFSPQRVAELTVEGLGAAAPSVADDFDRDMRQVLSTCNGHELNPRLSDMRAQLVQLRDGGAVRTSKPIPTKRPR